MGGTASVPFGNLEEAKWAGRLQAHALNRVDLHIGHYGAVLELPGPIYGAQKGGTDKMAADMPKSFVCIM
jgi:hypothetical protein